MKQDAIHRFTHTIKQDLNSNFPVIIRPTTESLQERVGQMHQFIATADEKYADLYFDLIDANSDLKEEDLDEVLLNETKAHFGV